MPQFVILIGVPASGKSTWISNNIDNFDDGVVVLSTDAIIEREASKRSLTYSEYFKDGIADADKEFWNAIDVNIANEMDIVIDRTNLTAKSRKRLLDMVPDYYDRIAVFFQTPNSGELRRRLDSRPGKTIPHNVMNTMIHSIEYPTYAEGFDDIMDADNV